jgi:hypothetical protein
MGCVSLHMRRHRLVLCFATASQSIRSSGVVRVLAVATSASCSIATQKLSADVTPRTAVVACHSYSAMAISDCHTANLV